MTYLNKMSDVQLVELVKNQADNEAFLEICKRYENIFYKVCQKYLSFLIGNGINPEDVFQEKDFVILKCIQSFEPTKKAKLGTWIGNHARYLCLNAINKRDRLYAFEDEALKQFIEDSQDCHNYFERSLSKDDYEYIVFLLKKLKDERVCKIFEMRYLRSNKATWPEIAAALNTSIHTVTALHNHGKALLYRKLKSRQISDIV